MFRLAASSWIDTPHRWKDDYNISIVITKHTQKHDHPRDCRLPLSPSIEWLHLSPPQNSFIIVAFNLSSMNHCWQTNWPNTGLLSRNSDLAILWWNYHMLCFFYFSTPQYNSQPNSRLTPYSPSALTDQPPHLHKVNVNIHTCDATDTPCGKERSELPLVSSRGFGY